MIFADQVRDEYFEWMVDSISGLGGWQKYMFRNLLSLLHNIEFRYSIPNDSNRAEDGIGLRYRFAYYHPDMSDAELYLEGPCTVLEMMVALAIRMEESIMDDPCIGNRTSQWFWEMIVNMGLGSLVDDKFDKQFAIDTVERFLNRDYEADGHGGLFRVRQNRCDLRTVEIWYQMHWYLDTLS